jgi:hypothetical protein
LIEGLSARRWLPIWIIIVPVLLAKMTISDEVVELDVNSVILLLSTALLNLARVRRWLEEAKSIKVGYSMIF